ncbi:hypothetical protein B0T19DRAFT_10570 [Cercophora scortea]|uniref:C2H2-type domain-containing protein n=1 Tax=Cercophora scortea TaxID=314031 RepID=A0AAE0J2X4_9PEZI|nr:hypothetical protein B0T19DRAFT_10570 [Cercophora scortea]
METMMTPQAMGPTFFYYSHDPSSENRQQGHFTSHPGFQHHQMGMFPVVPTLPSTPIYSRPSSSSSQPQQHQFQFQLQHQHHQQQQQQHPIIYTGMPNLHSTMLRMTSPQPMHQKPTIMLETDLNESNGLYYPSTPPLSSSGSSISSPGSCDMLQTPCNPMFSGLDHLDRKEGCDVKVESFAHSPLDWSSCASPPMTPVYLPSQSLTQSSTGNVFSLNNHASDLLSTASCPSLSPSPSPYARSVSSDDLDFCDPRNLTVGSAGAVNSNLTPEFSPLHALCARDDEEHHKSVLRGEAFVKAAAPAISLSPNPHFEFNPQLHRSLPSGLPSFEDFSDLEQEDDFVNGLVNLGENIVAPPATTTATATTSATATPTAATTTTTQIGRSRASSDAVSLCQSNYVCDDDSEDLDDAELFSANCLPSPPDSCQADSDAHQHKRQKKSPSSCNLAMNTVSDGQSGDAQSGTPEQQSTPPANDGNTQETNSSEVKNNSEDNDANSENHDDSASTPLPAPANRRGRKQSLTEDPSKTFKCELCNRRFRRQEHLKRHYRSLHTEDKPFECHECGKKFSRSDNLAQHSRTHGSGAIVMDLIDHPDHMGNMHPAYHHAMMTGMPSLGGGEDYHNMSKVLFQVTAEIPGSESDHSSDEDSENNSKKRKRME